MGMEESFKNEVVQKNLEFGSNKNVVSSQNNEISNGEKEAALSQRKAGDQARIEDLKNELMGRNESKLTLRQKRDNLKGVLFTDPEARGKIAKALGVSEDDIDMEGLEGVKKYKSDGDQILDRTVQSAHMMGWTEWKLKNGEILFANPDGTLGVKDTSN